MFVPGSGFLREMVNSMGDPIATLIRVILEKDFKPRVI